MAIRGDKLRERILYAAKNVFLEMGFERASMDLIAERAETSKRTLYAHFENKEKLYLAIIDLVRDVYLSKLRSPSEYSADASEALVQFCGRYLESLVFIWTVRMCQMCLAEASRFPEGSARYFDVIFSAPLDRLRDYLQHTFSLSEDASVEHAKNLLGTVIYPRFQRALFGVDTPTEFLAEDSINPHFDLSHIRKAVTKLLESLAHDCAN